VKTFNDVKGCDEAKAELEEIVEYLKNPAKFTRLGGKLPKVTHFKVQFVYDSFCTRCSVFCF
jgi:ATP-dependent Zn protease